jgi:predicted MFS family arabinose efflux permease
VSLPGFRRLAAAYAINDIGDMVGAVALAILVFDETGDPLATTALFVASRFVPAFLAPALTARVDQLAVGPTLAVIYASEAVLFAGLTVLTDAFALWLILVIALVDGAFSIVARALTRGSIAVMLEPAGLLHEGNALFNVIFAASTAAGPALAGLLIAWQGVAAALALDAASFAIIAGLLAVAKGLRGQRTDSSSWASRFKAGFAWVRDRPYVRRLLVSQATAFIFFACVVPIEVIYAKETLNAGNAGFGALLSAWGGGIVVGSLVFAVARRVPALTLIGGATLAIGVSYAGQALAPTLSVACVFAVLGGLGNGMQTVAVQTAIQLRTPEALQARVSGLMESLAAATPGIGFVLGGVLTSLFDPRTAFAAAACGVALVVVLGGLALARSPEQDLPRSEPEAKRQPTEERERLSDAVP